MKAGLNKDGRSHGEQLEDGAEAPEKGGLGDGGGSSSGGEAGGPPKSQGGIWRCLMRCKVGGLDHELPSGLI